jgi:hypothetical protein
VKEVILDLELLFLIEIKLMLADFNRKGFFFLLKFKGQFFLLLSDLGNEIILSLIEFFGFFLTIIDLFLGALLKVFNGIHNFVELRSCYNLFSFFHIRRRR